MNQNQEVENLVDKLFELNEYQPELLQSIWTKKNDIKYENIKALHDKLVYMHENPEEYVNVKAKTRGDLLEELIKSLTIETKVFDLFDNVSNDTNEYDIIIKPKSLVRTYGYNAFPDIIFQLIICECKNYQGNVDVTWVGKFYSLLSMSNVKVGILFSYEGITGEKSQDWSDAWGLIRKIYLKDNIAILNIGKNEIARIVNGESFCEILEEKFVELQTMTQIENEKRLHNSEMRVEELLDKIEKEAKEVRKKK